MLQQILPKTLFFNQNLTIMKISDLVNEIFEKSFSRESLERLLTREIKHKLEYLLNEIPEDGLVTVNSVKLVSETLKSE